MTISVGVIGLGALGEPIAGLFLKAGFATSVCDVRREPVERLAKLGARACASSAEVARHSDVIVSLVLDEAQTMDVVLGKSGLVGELRPGAIVAIGSTLGPEPVRRIAQALAPRRAHVLDIPISGGIVAAREGALSVMAGGDDAVLERALPVLKVFARDITRTGAVGSGQIAKLAHQLVFSVNVMALLEGLALGAAGGLEPAVLKEVLRKGLANSAVLQAWPDLGSRWKGMLAPSAPGAPLPNMRKDLHLVLQMAEALGVPLHIASQASRTADSGQATGLYSPDA
ncbi:MAG TPA: NAD(P)-dependent oxidoreductase [Burkholderiales bacterium]|nr:NAD(P)-dependent oxidoreductase [Burkholderiales bacterium]HVJ24841.1 NAD(P)-dependent oxidoreductase [Burkholderiales bacterium]